MSDEVPTNEPSDAPASATGRKPGTILGKTITQLFKRGWSSRTISQTEEYHPRPVLVPLGAPRGVLAVHIRSCTDFSNATTINHGTQGFLRLTVREKVKCTMVQPYREPKEGRFRYPLFFNEWKYFAIQIPKQDRNTLGLCKTQRMVVELIFFDPETNAPKLTAKVFIKLLDIFNKTAVTDVFDMKLKRQVVCKLNAEVSITYGSFGYGYSHQLQHPKKGLDGLVERSLFLRVPPPKNRTDPHFGVLAASKQSCPNIISSLMQSNTPGSQPCPARISSLVMTHLEKRGRLMQLYEAYMNSKDAVKDLECLILKKGPCTSKSFRMTKKSQAISKWKKTATMIPKLLKFALPANRTESQSMIQEESAPASAMKSSSILQDAHSKENETLDEGASTVNGKTPSSGSPQSSSSTIGPPKPALKPSLSTHRTPTPSTASSVAPPPPRDVATPSGLTEDPVPPVPADPHKLRHVIFVLPHESHCNKYSRPGESAASSPHTAHTISHSPREDGIKQRDKRRSGEEVVLSQKEKEKTKEEGSSEEEDDQDGTAYEAQEGRSQGLEEASEGRRDDPEVDVKNVASGSLEADVTCSSSARDTAIVKESDHRSSAVELTGETGVELTGETGVGVVRLGTCSPEVSQREQADKGAPEASSVELEEVPAVETGSSFNPRVITPTPTLETWTLYMPLTGEVVGSLSDPTLELHPETSTTNTDHRGCTPAETNIDPFASLSSCDSASVSPEPREARTLLSETDSCPSNSCDPETSHETLLFSTPVSVSLREAEAHRPGQERPATDPSPDYSQERGHESKT